MDEAEVWAAVDRRREALVLMLSGLDRSDWQRRSLCDGWTIHDVAAHLTMPLIGIRRLLPLGLRHPGGTNTFIREVSKELARRHDPDQVIANLRSMIGFHRHFPTLTCREALIDVLGHSLDIAIPLGRAGSAAAEALATSLPPVEVAEAADRVTSYAGRGRNRVFRDVGQTGPRLVASDHSWTFGDGPEIRGTMTDLFLLLIGRTVHLDRLTGEGVVAIRQGGERQQGRFSTGSP